MALPRPAFAFPRDDGRHHIVYTGAAGPLSPRLVALLFSALQRHIHDTPADAERLRLHFVGTSYALHDLGQPAILPAAQRFAVSSLVTETPDRIGFFEALRLQQDSDALLLVGSDDPAYCPSKLFPYYLTGRPILALVFRGSVLERQIDELACAYVVRWSIGEAEGEALARLGCFFRMTAAGTPGRPQMRRDDVFESRYLAEGLARRQCQLFDRCAGGTQ